MTVPLLGEWDVLVIGAGSAGIVAAIAAAETGASTLLIERYGFMGGISTGVLDTFYGFYTPGISKKVVGGIPDRVVGELEARRAAFTRPNTFGAGTGITYDPETLKMVWEDLAIAAGVDLLYHTFGTQVVTDAAGRRVTDVIVDGKSGPQRIGTRQIIDTTGDADICDFAGASYERAGDLEPAQTLTTTFRLANVDTSTATKVSRRELHQMMRDANAKGTHELPREEGSIHRTPVPGGMLAIMTRMDGYDPTDTRSLTAAEIAGRRQVREYVRFLTERVPGYQHARLVALSTQVGVRESRRVYGDYRLTGSDVMNARTFEDAIGQCGAPIEDHHGGSDTVWKYIPDSGVYDIPFRTLIPRDLDNVLVAGRCFSATHEAHASCRSMGQCMAMGQSAGTAAALCIRHRRDPRELPVHLLQDRLRRDGAVLSDEQQIIVAMAP